MKKKDSMPSLVYLGLWGVNSKLVALLFALICIVAGVVLLIKVGVFAGACAFVAAGWYLYAIRWVDKNSTWND